MTVRSEIAEKGFVLLSELDPDLTLEQITSHLGRVWSVNGSTKPHLITPKAQSAATPNTYSGIYGLRAFPLHTDLAHWREPPRFVVLRCKVPGANVITPLLDGLPIIEKVGRSVLARSLAQPRRPVQGSLPLLRLYSKIDETLGILRWDLVFIKPASPIGLNGFDLMYDAIYLMEPIPISLKRPGDTLIIDNWRMLHGRSAIPPGSENREIERAYLEEIF